MKKINKFLVFLIPVFLALPDIVIPLPVINLRVDDLIVYFLLLINLKKVINFRSPLFIQIQKALLIYVGISLVLAFALTPERIGMYEVSRTIGSIPYLLVFPVLLNDKDLQTSFLSGIFFGGLIYLGTLIWNFQQIRIQSIAFDRSASFKNEMSFKSLNPNTVSILALIFAWANLIAYHSLKKRIFLINLLLFLVPFFTLSRGSSVGVFAGIGFFVLLNRSGKIKNLLIVGLVIMGGWYTINNYIGKELIQSATTIDVETGQGFSGRYELWGQGLQLVAQSPIFGYGFSTENGLYVEKFDGHMAHQILLHYSIELGLVVLLIFLGSIFYLLRNRWEKYKSSHDTIYLIQLCMFSGFFIADMSSQLLYFNKYAYIIYALATLSVMKTNQ